ncbi:iron complex outermembrane receptor protein [Rhizorhapis suberifaciens]|uniref:Iron complex outermembrane receptor protein n=1 Tax=Rhizorhapis suberifaciens TaxID=13656 RepID=A0A840HTA1_9SPHN|nr:iron complex outermembrane receptor protein [Rhizorhapis suberifaciens]
MISTPVIAQDTYHKVKSQDIVVTGVFQRSQQDILSGTSVLTGTALVRDLKPTIGDTLAKQPGVSATSFGPNASRPILRGLQGERVRALTDGIGSFDVSNTSVDHAVVINPLTAERIEVLRGPSALLFGSAAIGGVVNVVDRRIPRQVPDEPVHIEGLATYGTAANERSISAAADAPLSDKIVFHMDGSYSKTDDLDTGSHILSGALRAEAASSDDPAIAALADLKGKLPNSASETWNVAGGLALITDGGNLGFSVSHFDSLYGVPVRYALDPSTEAEKVRLNMKQTRADVRAEVNAEGGFLDKIRFRAGFADYQHEEIEETGEVGTTFFSQGLEARLELLQAKRGGWEGAFGGQMLMRNFDVDGEEKFLPKNETRQFGFFTLQSLDLGKLRAEAGARYEHSDVSAAADADIGNSALRRTFDSISGSIGASYAVAEGWRLGVNGSHSQRAPSAEELFANGPHAGTQSFEIGNTDLKEEKSWGLEATLHGSGDGYSFSASAYHSWFDNYIYDERTGAIEDGLPVYQYRQGKARYYGFEAEGSVKLAQLGGYAVNLDGLADYVRAHVENAGPAPRIPPLRMLAGLEAQGERLQGRLEVEHVFDQKRIAVNETPTDDYTLVNASLSFKPMAGNGTTIVLSANNIFDVEARRHASFLKDYAPLAGRDLRLSTRFTF